MTNQEPRERTKRRRGRGHQLTEEQEESLELWESAKDDLSALEKTHGIENDPQVLMALIMLRLTRAVEDLGGLLGEIAEGASMASEDDGDDADPDEELEDD